MNVYVVEYSACIAVDSSLHSVEKERQNYTIGVFSSILKAKSAVLNFVESFDVCDVITLSDLDFKNLSVEYFTKTTLVHKKQFLDQNVDGTVKSYKHEVITIAKYKLNE
ncbi:hypothetical protein [Streptococcus danieliae]|uniref:Uncharacterized protein n=1 Tax=Streptococcus danieliae TaxID=747656 RepID=A0A7Z0M516_9STRE|nr:hypothetical protein [Streptococcus danieliae]MBF0698815.1 hypothetical protein [Streptococcus danieliae]NYS95992.1 hypothetical protein [Streptococcus danieliae]